MKENFNVLVGYSFGLYELCDKMVKLGCEDIRDYYSDSIIKDIVRTGIIYFACDLESYEKHVIINLKIIKEFENEADFCILEVTKVEFDF